MIQIVILIFLDKRMFERYACHYADNRLHRNGIVPSLQINCRYINPPLIPHRVLLISSVRTVCDDALLIVTIETITNNTTLFSLFFIFMK